MQVTNFKALTKNTLRGFFTLTLDSGMVIHKCMLFEKNGNKWIGMPSEKFTKRDGTTAYNRTIEFTTQQVADNFRRQVVATLEEQGFV